MTVLAICFPLLVGAFLLAMERLETLLLPGRAPAAPRPGGGPAAATAPGGSPAPEPPQSPQQQAGPLAA